MPKRLKVTLPEGWLDDTDPRENGVLTYVREQSKSAGTLKMFLTAYPGGQGPQPTSHMLVDMAIKHVVMENLGRLDECSGGSSSSGSFGSAVFWSQWAPRSQVWFISNGLDLIRVWHICRAVPERTEVLEAARIAESVEIVEE